MIKIINDYYHHESKSIETEKKKKRIDETNSKNIT